MTDVCRATNPAYPTEYFCTLPKGHSLARLDDDEHGVDEYYDHAAPQLGAYWNMPGEKTAPVDQFAGRVRAQLVGEAVQNALDNIPYDNKLSEANIHVIVGEAAIAAMKLPVLGTRREWAVQVRTFIDGDFDKTFTEMDGKKFTEESARTHAQMWSNHPSGARLVYRDVPDWTATT